MLTKSKPDHSEVEVIVGVGGEDEPEVVVDVGAVVLDVAKLVAALVHAVPAIGSGVPAAGC